MANALKLKPAGRFCSGTSRRDHLSGDGLEMKADKAIDGCGAELLVAEVRRSKPFGGERPMWKLSSPVLICPTCDRGEGS